MLNGTRVAGRAGEVSSALRQVGFSVLVPGTTTATSRTTIRYAPGEQAKAEVFARYLASGAELEQFSTLTGVDAVLVTGADFTGVLTTPRPDQPSSTTTTTAPPGVVPPPTAPPC